MSFEHLAGLANLVSLGLAACRLKVDRLGDAGLAEEMMAAGDAHFKPEFLQELAKLGEIPRGVARGSRKRSISFSCLLMETGGFTPAAL